MRIQVLAQDPESSDPHPFSSAVPVDPDMIAMIASGQVGADDGLRQVS